MQSELAWAFGRFQSETKPSCYPHNTHPHSKNISYSTPFTLCEQYQIGIMYYIIANIIQKCKLGKIIAQFTKQVRPLLQKKLHKLV